MIWGKKKKKKEGKKDSKKKSEMSGIIGVEDREETKSWTEDGIRVMSEKQRNKEEGDGQRRSTGQRRRRVESGRRRWCYSTSAIASYKLLFFASPT